jgi:hypothetical protein
VDTVTEKLSWTQPCCERCWINIVGRVEEGVRQPHLLASAWQLERCSWCGEPTIIGLYVRHDPRQVPYPAVEEDQ